MLSFSPNSVGLYFRERVEKIKENGKKKNKQTKIENVQKGQEKYRGKNSAKNITVSSNFSVKLL